MSTLFAVLGWLFASILVFVAVLYCLIVADAALCKWNMIRGIKYPVNKRSLTTGDGMRVLVVYLPGILVRTADRPRVFYDALAKGLSATSADVLCVDYDGESFDAEAVADQIVTQIILAMRRNYSSEYGKLLLIGESLGGRVVNLVVHLLQTSSPEVAARLVRPIIIDAPFNHRDFASGGALLATVLRYVPMGRLVNRIGLADRLFTQPAGLPQAKNIANGGNIMQLSHGNALTYEQYVEWVKMCAHKGLSGHLFSVYRDQLVAIATMPWHGDAFSALPPIYLACTNAEWTSEHPVYSDPVVTMQDGSCPLKLPANATIKQPQALLRWMEAIPGMTVRVVRSTHCGYMERPEAWRAALEDAVRDATS